MFLLDFVNSVLQSIFSCLIVSKYLNNKNYNKLIISILGCTLLVCNYILNAVFKSFILRVLLGHIALLIFMCMIYKKERKKALVSFSLAYAIVQIYIIFFRNILVSFGKVIRTYQISELAIEFLFCTGQAMLIIFLVKKLNLIRNSCDLLIYENLTGSSVIVSFMLDSIIILVNATLTTEGINNKMLLINIMFILFTIFLGCLMFYISRIKKKSKEVSILNEAMESKNNELRRIKHDYGAQISYLYGLCLMNRQDDLKRSLKNIINKNETTKDSVKVVMGNEKNNSVLALALKPAVEQGVNVVLEEEDLYLIDINEMELFRIVSNIVNNAVRAMKGEGTIIAKAHKYLNTVVIKIRNNGPKIPEQIMSRIFESGFTTKDNSDNSHGYGLNIVKELVEKNNGEIKVNSNDDYTEFKIIFKINDVKNIESQSVS